MKKEGFHTLGQYYHCQYNTHIVLENKANSKNIANISHFTHLVAPNGAFPCVLLLLTEHVLTLRASQCLFLSL